MTKINRIKEELDQRKPWSEWDSDVAALVEYYKAAEEFLKLNCDDPYWSVMEKSKRRARLAQARAKLEAQDG